MERDSIQAHTIRAFCRGCLRTGQCRPYPPLDNNMICDECREEYPAVLDLQYGRAVDALIAEIGAGR